MNLIELFDELEIPNGKEKVFNALHVPDFPNFRIAVDFEGCPVILFSGTNGIKNIALKNFRLKYLQLQQNVECKILENGISSFQTFTVITFTNGDRNLQEYFLRISETLIKSLSLKPTQQQVIDSLNKFIEVFRSLTDTPTNTVHGLWTELFLIEKSKNPNILLNYWHQIPEEKFDFNAGNEKIEVKSSSSFERIHTFSSEQLHPPANTHVLIASIYVRQNNSGLNIQQLIDSIITKIQFNIELSDKLNNLVCKTLGSSLEQSIKIKFDYNIAKDSLRFYRYQDIIKIEEIHIPSEVFEVRYKSDLTAISPIDINKITKKGQLFESL
ncbi:MAG TPA: hypothetical protein DCG75_03555 [Bacteroidales bacterium]|nr:hypothetical protein [Bacteroidales bacterium]